MQKDKRFMDFDVKEFKKQFKLFPWLMAGLFVLFLLFSCATCKDYAIHNAREYKKDGYEVRIAAYCMDTFHKVMAGYGSGHAQAQVFVNGEWKWVGTSGDIQDGPSHGLVPIVTETGIHQYLWWELDDFIRIKDEKGKPLCGENYWWILWLAIGVI